MMNRKDIETQVKEALALRLNTEIERIKLETRLVEDLGMDSFGAVEVVFELKDRFGIEIPQEDLVKIKEVKDIVEYIANSPHKE